MSTPKPSAPSDKPREFWIDDVDFDLGYHTTMVAEFPHKDTLANSIHVIEYSAFSKTCEQLLGSHAELVELRSAYKSAIEERDAIKAQLAEVREAYELKRMAFDLLAQGAAKVTRENVRLKDELMRLNGLKDER